MSRLDYNEGLLDACNPILHVHEELIKSSNEEGRTAIQKMLYSNVAVILQELIESIVKLKQE